MTDVLLAMNANFGQEDCSRSLWRSNLFDKYSKLLDSFLVPKTSSEELKKIYEQHGATVFRFAVSLLKSDSAAEDLVHDVFLRYWTSNKYDIKRGSKLSFLLTLTKSMAINQINKTKNRKRILDRWSNFFNRSSRNYGEVLENNETTTNLQIAFANLSDAQRQVIELCYVEGLSHKDASKQLRLPLGTIKTHARRGLINLKSQIANIDKGLL